MKPRGQLMIEHRLIEKVLIIANIKALEIGKSNYDPLFIDKIVDFIKTYADRTHHGKEEDILFAELNNMNIDEQNKTIMTELINEHKQARGKVKELVDLNMKYRSGNTESVKEIADTIKWLAAFYPIHIEKEDKVFFPNSEKYFDSKGLSIMMEKFNEFDRNMIHEKYHKFYKDIAGIQFP